RERRRADEPDAERSAQALRRARARGRSVRGSGASAVRLRVATCKTLPEADADEAPLAAALAAAGIDAPLVAWDDPTADRAAPIPTIIRSTWNYPSHLDAFLAWLDRGAAAAPLLNPPDIVRTNVHKRYLYDLHERGVPVVPTLIIEKGDLVDVP